VQNSKKNDDMQKNDGVEGENQANNDGDDAAVPVEEPK